MSASSAETRVSKLRLAVYDCERAIDRLEQRQAEVEQLLNEAPNWRDA